MESETKSLKKKKVVAVTLANTDGNKKEKTSAKQMIKLEDKI